MEAVEKCLNPENLKQVQTFFIHLKLRKGSVLMRGAINPELGIAGKKAQKTCQNSFVSPLFHLNFKNQNKILLNNYLQKYSSVPLSPQKIAKQEDSESESQVGNLPVSLFRS